MAYEALRVSRMRQTTRGAEVHHEGPEAVLLGLLRCDVRRILRLLRGAYRCGSRADVSRGTALACGRKVFLLPHL